MLQVIKVESKSSALANHEHLRCELLGGAGGMLPRKILKYRVSEIAFSAFQEHDFSLLKP